MRTTVQSIHIIGTRNLGGAESFFVRLVNALNADGYRTMAVVRPGSEIPAMLDPRVPVELAGMWNGGDVLSMLKIRRLVKRHRPEVVQTYMGRATRLTRLGRRSSTGHVARLGGYYRPASYRHVDVMVANTRGICDYLLGLGFASERVVHIGNFVTPPPRPPAGEEREVRRELDLPADAYVIFALGRFVPKKGFADLIEAMADLPAEIRRRPLYLVLAGDGFLSEELHRLADVRGVGDRIRWPGWALEPGRYFRLADLFVCPSRHEPLGNVILEAWNHGLPVISTRTSGAVELIEPDVTGVLTEIEDPEGLASAIRALAGTVSGKANTLAKAGLEEVRDRHSLERVVRAYRNLYGRVRRR